MNCDDTHNGTIALSIVVPCYKTEAYLPRCLDSLLAQTLRSIEIICVNDGSPDGTMRVLNRYQSTHADVIRVLDLPNRGVWSARWSGSDQARGEYVAYVDSDDWVDEDYAERLVDTACQEDSDIVICGFRRISEDGQRVLSDEMGVVKKPFLPSGDPGDLIGINTAVWNKAFKSSLLGRMHRLERVPVVMEDVAFNQLAFLAADKSISFVGRTTYNYAVRRGSAIDSVTPAQVSKAMETALEVRHCYEADGASADMLEALDAMAFLHLGVSMAFRLLGAKDVNLSKELGKTTSYLDAHFPTWRNNRYLNWSYAKEHGGALKKLCIARAVYKAHMMPAFLATYRFMIDKLHVDIKW